MSQATSSVQRRSFQFVMDGFIYSSFRPSVLSGQDVYIVVLKGVTSDVSGQQSLGLRSWPSCVVPFVYGEVVSSSQCTNLHRDKNNLSITRWQVAANDSEVWSSHGTVRTLP